MLGRCRANAVWSSRALAKCWTRADRTDCYRTLTPTTAATALPLLQLGSVSIDTRLCFETDSDAVHHDEDGGAVRRVPRPIPIELASAQRAIAVHAVLPV